MREELRWALAGASVAVAVMLGGAAAIWPQYGRAIPAAALLRVPVSGVYPGAINPAPNIQNPLANDPSAVERGKRAFEAFNCSGCHMANGGGGMGPALSNNKWIYRSSPANIYLTIVQGRSAGMPAWGAMLPDRTVWELVAYIKSISSDPTKTFGTTTSINPQSPDTEQVSANKEDTSKPWGFTEPFKNGQPP